VLKKKKVLLVVRWPVGGIRTFLRYVYNRFDSNEWHFTILAPDFNEMRVLVNEDLNEQDIRYVPVKKEQTFLSFSRHVFIEFMHNRYDIVHSHGFTAGMSAAIPARLFATRHIMTSHDVINANQFEGFKGRIDKIILKYLFGLVDKIQSVSHDAQANLLAYFPSLSRKPDKCIVITNGIEVERFIRAKSRDLRGELGLAEDVFLIGFFGRFMSQKGFSFLIDAIELLSNEQNLPKKPLVLTFGDGGFADREKRSIKSRGLDKYFCYLPFTPDVSSTINGLDVVAMPSLWEACGLLAMETLVCGMPLIASDCIGLREVVNGTPAIIAPKADADRLAKAIKREMSLSSKASFKRFQATAVKIFDTRKTSASVKQLYESVVR
jgi:glycosyltransferase involved in cell wall biosynthesis